MAPSPIYSGKTVFYHITKLEIKKKKFQHVFSDLEDALQTKLEVERQWNTGKQFQIYPLKKTFKKLFYKSTKDRWDKMNYYLHQNMVKL